MSDKLERFTDLLKQIFELDKSDLDFGIYRIMNIRKAEIEKFLTEGLPEKVRETLAPFAQGDQSELKKQIADIEKNAAAFGMDVNALPDDNPMGKKYRDLQKQLAEGTDLAALETDVYSALYSFFNRYYEDGDFISKRRYKEGVYAIPYEGEEVKLYWANQDQYYIKTSENFKDYTFLVEEYTVHFRLVDATTEQNNNKESADSKRTFMLFTEDEENYPGIKTFEYNEEAKELVIRFIFDIPEDKKKKYLEENYQAIRKYVFDSQLPMWQDLLAPIPTGKGKETTDLLLKHLNGYVAKNTFDYFIHKDLRGFLTRELDFYIKTEIMHLDDLDTDNEAHVETYLAKIKAIKRVGKTIIDFLAQVEDFQKKLWLKKKFVVETNWCITLDKIDERFYPEIAANNDQMEEWISMYAVDEIKPAIGVEGWTNPPTMEFMSQNQNLLIDTRHFPEEFKQQLIGNIDNVDNETLGVMLNADNFHALNLLSKTYAEKVKCVYIDPPYNAQSSEILYKNTFKHSAWLSLINDRIELSRTFLRDDAVYVCAIDEVEQERLGMLLNGIFSAEDISKTCVTVVHNPSGQQGDNFSATHEYAYFMYRTPGRSIAEQKRDDPKEWDKRGLRDVTGNESLRTAGKTCFYPIYVKDGKVIGFGPVCADEFHPPVNIRREDGVIEVYPVDPQGIERKWRFGRDNIEGIRDQLMANYIKARDIWDIQRLKKSFNYKTVWQAPQYSANNYGTQVLNRMFEAPPFTYPKSIHTVCECIQAALNGKTDGMVLDFFAGSGTTGQAVMKLNSAGRNLKFVLAEMGTYFNQATLPRVKKSCYQCDETAWKDGKPTSRSTRISQIIKYMRLESYEDALSNIELKDDSQQMSMLLGDEYLIHYMLDLESKDSLLDVDAFKNPFEYKMKITEKNECKERNVDLCETFNYLIGLTVVRQSAISYFSVRNAANPAYEGAVELTKDIDGEYAYRQIEGTLPDGRRALIIWRTISEDLLESNAALDAYFSKYRINPLDREYDVIFVNGDNNLENLRTVNESWKVQMTEIEFKNRMFEEA